MPRSNTCLAEEALGIRSDPCGLSYQALLLRISVAQRVIAGRLTRGHQ